MTAWEEAELKAAAELKSAGIDNGGQEARWLREYAQTAGRQVSAYQEFVLRRVKGEPLQYIMGNVQFYDVELDVGPGVLIPRPETEVLVELSGQLYSGSGKICDLCTGSGCIALSLAKMFPMAQVYGVDLSAEALAYAKRNCAKLRLTNVQLLQGDLFNCLPEGEQFALVTANPPYVSQAEYETLEAVVKEYEPEMALVAADDGVALIRRIAEEARRWLAPGGWLAMEIGDTQGARTAEILRRNGYGRVKIHRDYTGRDRIAVACME